MASLNPSKHANCDERDWSVTRHDRSQRWDGRELGGATGHVGTDSNQFVWPFVSISDWTYYSDNDCVRSHVARVISSFA